MLTINKIGGYNNIREIEFNGLSTDEKPVNKDIANGSVYHEMDTKKDYRFDAENQIWLEQ